MSRTIRQSMAEMIRRRRATARDLASALLLTPSEVEHHLAHLKRSHKNKLAVRPAECLACGFIFEGRAKLKSPGRCPRCRAERIEGPWFFLRP